MSTSPTITIAEAAALLGVQKDTLQHRIAAMRRTAGFPAPIPYSGGRRYSRDLVLAWINGMTPATRPATATVTLFAPDGPALAEAEATLLRRAHAMLPAE
ncbi:MAG: hypothetical protein ACKVQR_04315 [Aquabacterium sp.]